MAIRWDRAKFFEGLAMFIVVVGGFMVFILCLQLPDDQNGGIPGIGGDWRAVVVIMYLAASTYMIYRRTEERDRLRNEAEHWRRSFEKVTSTLK